MKQRGYTLMELVITMGIVGLLAAIAIPSFKSYTQRTNRTDATRSMTVTAQALERCYSQNFTYQTGCPTVAGSTPSPQGFYTLTIAIPTASSFTITAVPVKAPQTTDSTCTQFTLNSAGTQGAINSSSASSTQTCWGST